MSLRSGYYADRRWGSSYKSRIEANNYTLQIAVFRAD